MKLIIGLGNPGKEYQNTKHNIGFDMLDTYIDYKNINDSWSKKFDGLYIKTKIDDEDVIFLKPQTFMNLSGNSVRKVIDYFDISIKDILVISDDLDLLVGNYKLKSKGSCGGHNGLRNIEECINTTEYKRLKIGISNDKDIDTKDYVLGKFSKKNRETLEKLFKDLCLVLDDYFILSFTDLMNKYNQKNRWYNEVFWRVN